MTNREAAEYLDKYVMNVAPYGKWKEVVELAISALQAQEAKTQLSAEGTTSDLISRQDAIEVIEEMQMPIMRSMFPEEQFVFKGMSEALSAIKDLPSAKPEIEERKEESAQNVPKEDLISRKEAIDALMEIMDRPNHAEFLYTDEICKTLNDLPSAQPEPQWIPVSEKLPGENEFVLVTFGWFGRKTDPGVNIDKIRDGDWMISEVVTAWMPLPEPYRAERRTDD